MRRIIKSLQDVENLKKVIFSETQRQHFEQIPKPELQEEIISSTKRKSYMIGIENFYNSGRTTKGQDPNLKADAFIIDKRIQNLIPNENEILSSIPGLFFIWFLNLIFFIKKDEMKDDECNMNILLTTKDV